MALRAYSAGSIASRATPTIIAEPGFGTAWNRWPGSSACRGPASEREPAARSALVPGGIRALAVSLTASEPSLLIVAILPGRGLTGVTSGT
jgi:hypothetical protein